MELITKQLDQVNLITSSSIEIEEGFEKTFLNVFNFNEKEIKVIGTVDKPYFRIKDILKILGYSDNRETTKNLLKISFPINIKKK